MWFAFWCKARLTASEPIDKIAGTFQSFIVIIAMLTVISKEAAWWKNPPAGSEEAANKRRDSGLSQVFRNNAPLSTEFKPSEQSAIPKYEMSQYFRGLFGNNPDFGTIVDIALYMKALGKYQIMIGFDPSTTDRLFLETSGPKLHLYHDGSGLIDSFNLTDPISILKKHFINIR